MATLREQISQYLQTHEVVSDEGRATAKLAKALKLSGTALTSVSSVLRSMERDGEVKREIDGKRTYSIKWIATPSSNGQEPAPAAPTASEGEDYVKLGLGVLQAASRALTEVEELRATIKAQKDELEAVRGQLQAKELACAALERQVAEAKVTADRVAATLPTEVKRDVQKLLNKVKRLG